MRLARCATASLIVLAGLVAVVALFYLHAQGVTPRALAPYIERRSSGHNALITGTGSWTGAVLRRLDRGTDGGPYPLPQLVAGAQPQPVGETGRAGRLVTDVEQARQAFAGALAGDTITFAPGIYRVRKLEARRPGVKGAPIVVRAAQPGSVTIEFDGAEGFLVAAPYWRFENLTIRGVCKVHAHCEHAFHVTGRGQGFAALNNTISDFNAHFKINGSRHGFPDDGLIAQNSLNNGTVRKTSKPVTPIDLVAASGWVIRGNLITDFVKAGGDGISYGAFAKGAATGTLFERNVIVCEHLLRGHSGQRVGLSFGGGGSGRRYCRDGRCAAEHEGGTMRANLVASCSDAGIYVNRGANSRILDNTLLDTAGVQVRFAESSARLDGNLVDGGLLARDGGRLKLGDNRVTPIGLTYLGYHPQRLLFADPATLDLRWKDGAPLRDAATAGPDLCGAPRPGAPAYGAFEDFAACLRR
ncbi:right-handed parallel beta-helix repeat-containing protein [Massilia puerhi]|uniref:right-handed parallel beta-helix repeat-containing protein n=1 Tax=Massilia puerhi TaxID=2681550 RepID=UPI00135ACCE9|nr:right-handed parallel beta-helix repeat-containing protein [Massilia puerhi]